MGDVYQTPACLSIQRVSGELPPLPPAVAEAASILDSEDSSTLGGGGEPAVSGRPSSCSEGPGIFCSLLTGYLLLTRFWPLAALYLAWLTIDRHTPERGGRRSQWVRNWTVWRYMRDYFPISMVKMADLDPKRNYVFGSHPHGIMCFGTFCNFCTEATSFSRMFPGITPHQATLNGLFRLPIFRDYLLSGGGCSVSRSSLGHILSERGTGNAVIIVVGGAAESMAGTPGDHSVLLKDRMGFIRLALRHG
ncbi:diacylglycerol O-acyltransferase 2-like [Chiloscyllium plagiosum]|uniref:diacylglycerol O-acyltransferase 2-like n=1 Tax=Chiloscyllium plagiosum TaxID=36176 RepID=UPI001CB87D60|nr:diacylglycerol O-acyltransferase 2-like [Chiloscyllium plagiosum]